MIRLLLLATTFGLGLLTGCGSEPPGVVERPPVPVVVEAVRTVDLEDVVTGVGTLRAIEQVAIAPEVAGRVRALHFREGLDVDAGQLLVELDDDKLKAQRSAYEAALRAAGAQLADAERQLVRQREMRQRDLGSEEALDRAATARDGALAERDRLQAEIALIDRKLADMRLHAPFAGRISERRVDRGAYVGAGDVLAVVYRMDPLEVSFSVPERYLGRIREGQRVGLLVAAWPDESFEGVLSFIDPAIDEPSRSLRLKAELANPDGRLRPGAFVRARVVLDALDDRPVVAAEALVATRHGYRVFVVEDGRARSREVETGLRQGGDVEIRTGVGAGEQVVRSGHLRLNDGDRVRRVGPDGEAITP